MPLDSPTLPVLEVWEKTDGNRVEGRAVEETKDG